MKRSNLEIVRDTIEEHQTNNSRMARRKISIVRYPGLLPSKYKLLPLVACHGSNIANERATRRSTGGAAGIAGKREIIHKPTRQTSLEESTYGAELSAGRAGIDHCEKISFV